MTYDILGRKISRTDYIVGSVWERKTEWSYDSAGRYVYAHDQHRQPTAFSFAGPAEGLLHQVKYYKDCARSTVPTYAQSQPFGSDET